MAATRRPQLGSQPAHAVLTSGRMGDGLGDAEGIGVGGRAVDAEFNNVRDAFAVGDNLPGERGADVGERGSKCVVAGPDPGAACAGGEQKHGVVGGGVAIDGDAVEADFDCSRRYVLSAGGLDGRVGEDVDEHGGVRHELRMNHAGALADSGDADFLRDLAGALHLRE